MAYWFKRRRYGWGYTPVTWQGWLSVAVLVLLALVPAFLLPADGVAGTVGYLAYLAVVVVGFLVLAVTHGPRPRWRWGAGPGDDPDQDL